MEAHCVLEYGGDFRPDYRQIGGFIDSLTHRHIVAACSATLTPSAETFICDSLHMSEPVILRGGVHRSNIQLNVNKIDRILTKKDSGAIFAAKLDILLDELKWCQKKNGAAIVYCNTVSLVQDVTKALQKKKLPARSFYSSLTPEEKEEAISAFHTEKTPVIVATSAFGMGIDRRGGCASGDSLLPAAVHRRILAEMRLGWPGRQKARAALIFSHVDYQTTNNMIRRDREYTQNRELLNEMLGLARSEKCVTQKINCYYGRKKGKKCGHFGNCK